ARRAFVGLAKVGLDPAARERDTAEQGQNAWDEPDSILLPWPGEARSARDMLALPFRPGIPNLELRGPPSRTTRRHRIEFADGIRHRNPGRAPPRTGRAPPLCQGPGRDRAAE